jgi:hypothetical protein
MSTSPQEPDPDRERPEPSPIPGEKNAPYADEDQPEYEHESPRRVHGGEPS